MPQKIEAVIFDMDGVLVDAKEWHYDALNRALNLFGQEISRYDHIVTYDGLPTRMKLQMLSMERGLPNELHEFINEMKQIYTMEIVYTKCKPTFYHQFALSRLKVHGYRMAVCSNSVRQSIDMMLDRSDLHQYFDFFLSAEDVENPKPAPDIYTKAINRLGLEPEQCLIVEDNPNGIKAAQKSGAHLFSVSDVTEMTYSNIMRLLQDLEKKYA
ncbi:HAD family phosphatase [Alphaproteobacteria bacterium]|nr:HAD family phosphatase [Alphaproteobacteria bacterium]